MMWTVIIFCMVVIGWIIWRGLETSPAEVAVTMGFATITSVVGSYVFGATWDDRGRGGQNGDS